MNQESESLSPTPKLPAASTLTLTLTAAEYARFCQLVAGNVLNKDGNVRFGYLQLRRNLNIIEQGRDNIDTEVRELLQNCITHSIAKPEALSERNIVTLCLLLLNIQMGYGLLSGYTLNHDAVTNDR